MQKAYDIYFVAGCLLALALAAVAGVSLFHFVIGSEYLVFVPLAIIAVFFPLSLLFRASNKGWVLRLPAILARKHSNSSRRSACFSP